MVHRKEIGALLLICSLLALGSAIFLYKSFWARESLVETKQLMAEAETIILEEKPPAKQEHSEERPILDSSSIKGLYMTGAVANSPNYIKEDIKKLLFETELNGVVIDIKESWGPNMPNSLKQLIREFHEKNIYVIARIVVFRDSSLTADRPELYLQKHSTSSASDLWQDWSGQYWLDPASPAVFNYTVAFSKRAIDFGFDELQFDYLRFPSDGNLEEIIYPFYKEEQPKYEVIAEFSNKLSEELRDYDSDIVLSVDLFGYVATMFNSYKIGQRLVDFANTFDYLSFMLYPSHFYGGLLMPSFYIPYSSENIEEVVSNRPYEIIYESITFAKNYLSSIDAKAAIRPWMQDFDLKADTERGIFYDAEKIKEQIRAAENASSSGWLLWNAANTYTEDALRE